MSFKILWNQHRVGDAGFRNVQDRAFFYRPDGDDHAPWVFVPVTRVNDGAFCDSLAVMNDIYDAFGDVQVKVLYRNSNTSIEFRAHEQEYMRRAVEESRRAAR